MEIEAYRELFPITAEYAYLNNAAFGALPRPVGDALQRHLCLVQTMPIDALLDDLLALQEEVKEQAARLIGAARPDEIVQVSGTATGINIAARSLPLRAGDNVLVLDGDYPAVVYPWLNLAPEGILTKMVPQRDGGLDLDLLESRIDRRTRAVTISTAMFATGYRNDIAALGALCRARGIYLVVDAIQTLGCLPIDVRACNVDFLCAGSHKWLLSTPGSGLLYCRHELLDELQLGAYVGALSVVDPSNFLDYNFTFQPTSARFNVSVWNFPAFVAMHASLDLLLEAGIERIARRVLHLTDLLIADLQRRGFHVLSNLDPAHRSGIVIVEVADPAAACEKLRAARVAISARGAGIRVAPHFYNNEDDICRVGEALSA